MKHFKKMIKILFSIIFAGSLVINGGVFLALYDLGEHWWGALAGVGIISLFVLTLIYFNVMGELMFKTYEELRNERDSFTEAKKQYIDYKKRYEQAINRYKNLNK